MKRISTLIVLLGLAMGMVLTGCNKEPDATTTAGTTNTTTTTTSTNK